MKTFWLAILVVVSAGCTQGAGGGGGGATEANAQLTTEDDKTYYALGLAIGKNLVDFKLDDAQMALVKKGLTDQVKGTPPAVDLNTYMPKISEKARAAQQARFEDERKKAEAGLGPEKEKGKTFADNAAKEEGATKTESGLVYRETTAGKGATPAATDVVKVHYKGTLIDGTEFDSSYGRGQPATFPLNRVIKCWTEGVGKMKVGGKAKLTCPADIAYGDMGSPPKIPGGATLVFEVELIEIMAQPGAPAVAPVDAGKAAPKK